MNSLIQMLISSLVPILLQMAEQALGVSPNPQDPSWVAGLIKEVVGLVEKYIPGWLKPDLEIVEQLVAAEIEKLLAGKALLAKQAMVPPADPQC